MRKDTMDFLEAVLWVASDPEDDAKPFEGKTVYDFSFEMITAVESFIDGFRRHLEQSGFDMELLHLLGRSFGGNVYFSLSGHGVGFFDERNTELAELHDRLEKWSGRPYRFEELASQLCVHENGRIDLAFKPGHLAEMRKKIFGVEKPNTGDWFVGDPIRNEDCFGICVAWEDAGESGEETIAEVLPTPDIVTGRRQAELMADAPAILRALRELLVETDQHATGECPKLRAACDTARGFVKKHKEIMI